LEDVIFYIKTSLCTEADGLLQGRVLIIHDLRQEELRNMLVHQNLVLPVQK
jgi:hypothetical protein